MALEERIPSVAPEDDDATCRVFEKLRRPLSHLVGSAGVNSLMRRALTLAQRESSALHDVEVLDNGSLKGLEGEAGQESYLLVGHVISLLETFIGEALALRILHDVWPELEAPTGSLEKSDL